MQNILRMKTNSLHHFPQDFRLLREKIYKDNTPPVIHEQKRTNLSHVDIASRTYRINHLVYQTEVGRPMMNGIFFNERLQKIIEILVVLFGLYLLFQLIKKILGGSWSTEEIVVGLLIFNTGAIFTLTLTIIPSIVHIKADLNNLKMQFRALATDFKNHLHKKG